MKLLLISLLSLTSASHADEVAHLKVAHWITHTPKIVLCNGIKIPDSVIVEAVSRWKKRGVKIGSISRKTCKDIPNRGEIAFYIDDKVVGSHSGWTVRSVFTDTTDVAYARIWIRSDNVDSLILVEHELGHGLGYTDTQAAGHIMSKKGAIY